MTELSPNVCTSPLLNIVLYHPEIAANTGAVGRTCVGLGAKLWLIEPLGFQIEDRKVKRAGLDYWPYLDWEKTTNWDMFLNRLHEEYPDKADLRFFFLSKKGRFEYTDIQFQRGDILVFGPESTGLPDSFLTETKTTVRIPIQPEIRSLNLSVSVAIVGFEARRQIFHARL